MKAMVDLAALLHHDAVMRTTLSIDEDLYTVASAIARDQRRSLSAVVNEVLRDGLCLNKEHRYRKSRGRFPSFRTSRKVTSEDVRALEDEL
jgi:hypothetical protein